MRTLVPRRDFLRVMDKFFAVFALEDTELTAGATLLYLNLFLLAGQRDFCAPSQAYLARNCKSSERAVQTYLRQLVDLGYVRIERTGARNVYRLLCSTRIRDLSQRACIDMTTPEAPALTSASQGAACSPPLLSEGEKFSPVVDQIGAKYAPSIREKRIRHFPPSPVLNLTEQAARPARPSTPLASSLRTTSPCQGGRVLRDGRGDSLSLPASNPAPRPAFRAGDAPSAAPDERQASIVPGSCVPVAFGRDDFERLFAAWPRKQDKLNASRAFTALARAGELPPMDELLATVERFKAEDRAWRNGCVPNLRFWLQGHRWKDEIAPVTQPSAFMKPDPMASIPAVPADPVAQAQLAAQVRSVQEKIYARKEEGNELATAVDTLAELWPDEPRQMLFPRLVTARLRGVSVADVVKKALNWAGALPPAGEWFSMAVA